MAKWTLETALADEREARIGAGGPASGGTAVVPYSYVPGGIVTEQWETLVGGNRPVPGLPPLPENNGCTSGCGVPYPNSSPGTITLPGSSSQVRESRTVTETLADLFANFKEWPWWVWLIIAVVAVLVLRR